MGSMTRLGQGLTLENAVKGPHLRIARSGLHNFRVSWADVQKQKGISGAPIQVQLNNDGIGKPDLQWTTIKPRRALRCRSSAADAGAGDLPGEFGAPIKLQKDNKVKEMKGMAEAFDISPRTAFGITVVIAISALVLPFYMPSAGLGMALKTRGLSYLTLLLGFYMAWNIGANDVANAMGTSVGSGALTLRQAVLTAAILEFSGAFMVGSHVSHTMQSGIISANVFAGKETLLFCGMLSSLGAAGTWLQVASYFGWPVSTTHCIIGAMVGFGLVYGGTGAVYWQSLFRVVSSWVVSPLLGALVSFVVYKCIRMFVYSAPNPGQAAATAAPLAVFLGVAALSFTVFPTQGGALVAGSKALGFGLLGALIIAVVIRRQLGELLGAYCELPSEDQELQRRPAMGIEGPKGTQLKIVYSVFGYLQVLSACFMSFAHGANDVANAIGPISAALAILQNTGLASGGTPSMPVDVLAWGGFGIVAGLLVWGYRVIATIGQKITELTPTRGFAAEFAAATVVVLASRLGLPISATHTLVGAVMGVGFARGLNSVRGDVVKEIVASWMVTIPVGAMLSVIYTFIFIKLIPSLV
ncbi:hypothetical protein KC19_10G114900 [Ceratodon purpureus]|uniref:Phosphate transporter n=1 Tax=Ceratodon purpureus TaxID=3225 RepID=A0A8T0GMX3_CERPU|nr:hypothetical protein KC19_10G114900 [Ceratodon purpureus]